MRPPRPADAATPACSPAATSRRYQAKWRTPLVGNYRGRQIVAMPPPTSGGIALMEMLNILEDLRRFARRASSADHFHHIAEAQKIAFADRGRTWPTPTSCRSPPAR